MRGILAAHLLHPIHPFHYRTGLAYTPACIHAPSSPPSSSSLPLAPLPSSILALSHPPFLLFTPQRNHHAYTPGETQCCARPHGLFDSRSFRYPYQYLPDLYSNQLMWTTLAHAHTHPTRIFLLFFSCPSYPWYTESHVQLTLSALYWISQHSRCSWRNGRRPTLACQEWEWKTGPVSRDLRLRTRTWSNI